MIGLDSMNIRRIEAGIQNAGSDFNATTTPFDVGLGRFVDEDKGDFIGKAALNSAAQTLRFFGIKCETGEPLISGLVTDSEKQIGVVTAGAISPYLGHGIGYALLDVATHSVGAKVKIGCRDGKQHDAVLIEVPFYDKMAEIPRGKVIDIPKRP